MITLTMRVPLTFVNELLKRRSVMMHVLLKCHPLLQCHHWCPSLRLLCRSLRHSRGVKVGWRVDSMQVVIIQRVSIHRHNGNLVK